MVVVEFDWKTKQPSLEYKLEQFDHEVSMTMMKKWSKLHLEPSEMEVYHLKIFVVLEQPIHEVYLVLQLLEMKVDQVHETESV